MTGNTTGDFLKQFIYKTILPGWKNICFLSTCLLITFICSAQAPEESDYDQVSVSLEVKDVGNGDIPALYHDKEVYLSITHVLDLLKIKNKISPSNDTIVGFFLNEKDPFVIDKVHNVIHYQGKEFNIVPVDMVRFEANLYLNLKHFKTVFGLDAAFYFRRLVVTMSSSNELPVIREMRQELMRRNLNRLRGDVKADTTVKRTYPFLHFGMADWAVMAAQQSEGQDQTTLNLGLGGVLAGGEMNASLNYYSQQAFNEKLQYYQWRYVDNNNTALRQVMAGKIFTQATSSLYAPVVGVQFTNAPTTYRKSYGTYTLSQTTEAGWVVELYVNDILVDYKKADASGFFSFEVPLFYGYTIIKLRFYGPYGEERTSLQYINIPFNFLPAHELEYSASGGIVEDNRNSLFSRVSANYGVSSRMSVGGGVEYLTSVTSGNTMPFINSSLRLTSRLLLSGEYTYGVRGRGILSYRLPSSLQFDLDYIKYAKGQTAIYYNYLEERKASVSLPLHNSLIALFTRLTLDQILVPTTKYTNLEWAVTGSVRGVGMNVTTYASFIKEAIPYIYSILSLSFQLPAKIMFTSQVQYDYKESKPSFMKYTFERRLFGNGFANLAYQEFFNASSRNVLVGIRYDFSYARVALSALAGNNNTYSRVEAASGSLIYDHKTNYLNFNSRTNVGRGGIVFEPFLDVNCNGIRDSGEQKAPNLKIRINGGRIVYSEKDTAIRVLDLEPYNDYFVELSSGSFDNIAWQIKKRTLSITVNPNNFTVIAVPVAVVGEVTGIVTNKDGNNQKGLGQIIVNVYNKDGSIAAHTLTESDGFFSYLGLAPGDYLAQIDSAQLRKLNLRSTPPFIPVHISLNKDGDIADGLEFKLESSLKSATSAEQKDMNAGKTDTLEKQATHKKSGYAILISVYDNLDAAKAVQARVMRLLKVPVIIEEKKGNFKVEITGFDDRDGALNYQPKLEKEGYTESLIIKRKE